MFKALPEGDGQTVTIFVNDKEVRVPAAYTAAAAALVHMEGATRTTPVSGAPRAPYCLMGICFECLMEIDGVPNRQACMMPVAEGMRIKRQEGAREVIL